MSARVTEANPTGIASFDHARLAELPEYAAASRALDALARAIGRTERGMVQAEWLEVVTEMAAAGPYGDACQHCAGMPIRWPLGAEVVNGWVRGVYRCETCGRAWRCGWSVQP